MKNIINHEQPKYIYLPYDNEANLKINEEKHVLVLDNICTFENKDIYSTVSGNILGSQNVMMDSKNIKAIVIENDFKDRKKELIKTRPYFEYGKSDIKNIIKENNFEKENMNIIALKINYIKKYDESDYLVIKEYGKDILDSLDKISYAYDSNEVYIILDKKDKETKKELMNYLGTYPNIKIVKKLTENHSEYNVNELRALNNILKIKSNIRHIYLTANYKGNCTIIKTKKYIILKEVLSLLKIETAKIYDINKNEISEMTILNENTRSLIIK